MMAIQLGRFNDIDSLRLVDLDRPTVESGNVLVQVEAASFNPVDLWILQGRLGGSPPLVLGRDLSGIVVEVPDTSGPYFVGDRVYARLPWPLGSYAEFVAIPQAFVAKAPASIPLAHAAALPVVGLTALHCVERAHGLENADVFVAGASGGVGSIAVPLLRMRGIRKIFASARTPESRSYLVDHLGIDPQDILDPTDSQGLDFLRTRSDSIAATFDFAGGAMKKLCFDAVAPGGYVASIVEEPANFDLNLWNDETSPVVLKSLTFHFEQLGAYGVRNRPETWQKYGHGLSRLAAEVDQGRIRMPKIQEMGSFSVETIRAAYARLEARHSQGKMIMQGWSA